MQVLNCSAELGKELLYTNSHGISCASRGLALVPPRLLLSRAESVQSSAAHKVDQAFGQAWLELCVAMQNLNSRV